MENKFMDGTCSCTRDVYPRFMGAVEAVLRSVKEGYTSPKKGIARIEELVKEADDALNQLPNNW